MAVAKPERLADLAEEDPTQVVIGTGHRMKNASCARSTMLHCRSGLRSEALQSADDEVDLQGGQCNFIEVR